MSHPSSSSSSPSGKNKLEWSVFALSCLLIGATLGVLIWESLKKQDRPPRLELRLDTPNAMGEEVRVPVEIHNRGDKAAQAVEVEVKGMVGGKEEKAGFVFESIPSGGKRKGWVCFPSREVPKNLSTRILGYQEP